MRGGRPERAKITQPGASPVIFRAFGRLRVKVLGWAPGWFGPVDFPLTSLGGSPFVLPFAHGTGRQGRAFRAPGRGGRVV